MRITIVAVGALKEPHWRQAAEEYLKRLRPYATVEVVEVSDRDLSRDEAAAIAREGEDVMRAVPDGAHVIALDAAGTMRSSEEIAKWLSELMLSGTSHVVFVIGGAAGLAPAVRSRVAGSLSLGRITLPHQLARVVALEQIYRSFRIMRGEPYHR